MTDLKKFALFLEYAPSQDYREKVNKIIESEEALKVAGNLLMNIITKRLCRRCIIIFKFVNEFALT